MDFKEMITNKFVEGHNLTENFKMKTFLKLFEEFEEFIETLEKQEKPERVFSELTDLFQVTYTNLILMEKEIGKEAEGYKENWLKKQKNRIEKYRDKPEEEVMKGRVLVDGEEVELTKEQINLISAIIKGGRK